MCHDDFAHMTIANSTGRVESALKEALKVLAYTTEVFVCVCECVCVSEFVCTRLRVCRRVQAQCVILCWRMRMQTRARQFVIYLYNLHVQHKV